MQTHPKFMHHDDLNYHTSFTPNAQKLSIRNKQFSFNALSPAPLDSQRHRSSRM
jgi:hypothetical protein